MKSRTWMWTLLVWFFAALAMPVQARIVYTPVNVNLPTNGSYPIDLNHDGITDFTFQISVTQRHCGYPPAQCCGKPVPTTPQRAPPLTWTRWSRGRRPDSVRPGFWRMCPRR